MLNEARLRPPEITVTGIVPVGAYEGPESTSHRGVSMLLPDEELLLDDEELLLEEELELLELDDDELLLDDDDEDELLELELLDEELLLDEDDELLLEEELELLDELDEELELLELDEELLLELSGIRIISMIIQISTIILMLTSSSDFESLSFTPKSHLRKLINASKKHTRHPFGSSVPS